MCLGYLNSFLKSQYIYNLFVVHTQCSTNKAARLTDLEGYISSYVVRIKGCGLTQNPWIISANPGQTIQLKMIDFSTNPQSSNLVSCRSVYGFILERALGINQTICGGRYREMALYRSKTNSIQIHFRKRERENNEEFLIKYKSKLDYCYVNYFSELYL